MKQNFDLPQKNQNQEKGKSMQSISPFQRIATVWIRTVKEKPQEQKSSKFREALKLKT